MWNLFYIIATEDAEHVNAAIWASVFSILIIAVMCGLLIWMIKRSNLKL